MDFDISPLLEQWPYKPGQVVVRKFKAKDGKEKIQLRVDLGLLQMNGPQRDAIPQHRHRASSLVMRGAMLVGEAGIELEPLCGRPSPQAKS